jgi:hypothetical protein
VIEEIGRDKGGNDVAPPDSIKVLITKADGKPTMAVMEWIELQKLLKCSYAGGSVGDKEH